MPLDKKIKKVLVLGSGPIVIGQAAEFDYAGTQACRALREEGIEVILINSNPATIMTDKEVADKIYIEPLTWEFVEKVIIKEKPDSMLAGMGGQTGLNLASFIAVCPPNCNITPSGFSFSIIFNTSSSVIGSKYSLSEISKSVLTVSGLLLIIIVSIPSFFSAMIL